MKTLRFLCVVILCSMAFTAFAQKDLTNKQRNFQTEILSFLKTEGFAPYIDEDNCVSFKKEGKLYWISVYEDDPFFVSIGCSGFRLTGENKFELAPSILTCEEVTRTQKAVKLYCNTQSVAVRAEYFIDTISGFKATFYRYIAVLEAGKKVFLEKYYDYEKQGK